jgi:hypothetical protein
VWAIQRGIGTDGPDFGPLAGAIALLGIMVKNPDRPGTDLTRPSLRADDLRSV